MNNSLVNNNSNKYTIKLFFIFFILYSCISFFSEIYQASLYGAPNIFSDEGNYFGMSYSFIDNANLPSWVGTQYNNNFNIVSFKAYYLLITSSGYVLDKIGLHFFFFLKITSVLFGALSVVYIYYLLKIFVKNKDNKTLFYGASIFGLLPYMLLYSSVLLRDVIVLFFTIYSLVHILYFIKNNNLSILHVFFSIIILYFLRAPNSLFVVVMLISLLLFSKRNKIIESSYKIIKSNLFIKIITLLIFLFLAYISYTEFFLKAISTLTFYSDRSLNTSALDSLGAKLFLLPFPLDIISRSIFSQIVPFPIWKQVLDNPIRIIDMLGGIIWFSISVTALITIFFKRYRCILPKELILLYFFAILYIMLVSSGEANPRRLMALYPIIYVVSFISFVNFSSNLKKKYLFLLSIFFIVLHIIYLFIKY